MVKQVKRSSLAAKLGEKGRKAHEAHKADETDFGSGANLPAGIEGGVAQLVDCRFDKFKKGPNVGEYFFIAAGVVVRPAEHDGLHVKGLRTQIGPEPMCDTPGATGQRKTLDEHYDWVLNELRKLGVQTDEVDFDSIEGVCAALKEEAPYFRFRTWKGSKQTEGPYKDREPRVQHNWLGVCEFTEDEEDAVEDESNRFERRQDEGSEEEEEEEEKNSQEDEPDEEEEEEEEEWEPKKGEVYGYKPPKAKKPAECEVTAVLTKAKTVTLKNLEDGKTVYKGIAWDELEGEE